MVSVRCKDWSQEWFRPEETKTHFFMSASLIVILIHVCHFTTMPRYSHTLMPVTVLAVLHHKHGLYQEFRISPLSLRRHWVDRWRLAPARGAGPLLRLHHRLVGRHHLHLAVRHQQGEADPDDAARGAAGRRPRGAWHPPPGSRHLAHRVRPAPPLGDRPETGHRTAARARHQPRWVFQAAPTSVGISGSTNLGGYPRRHQPRWISQAAPTSVGIPGGTNLGGYTRRHQPRWVSQAAPISVGIPGGTSLGGYPREPRRRPKLHIGMLSGGFQEISVGVHCPERFCVCQEISVVGVWRDRPFF